MTDRRTDVPPKAGDEIARRARDQGPPAETPVRGASHADPPRPAEERPTEPPLPPGAR